MRGEYAGCTQTTPGAAELPPRARRIPACGLRPHSPHGTTSACAENTAASFACIIAVWNYLRVRGEYLVATSPPPRWLELPPRARRIHHHRRVNHAESGTTSACAENTHPQQTFGHHKWNYLRVRGEYTNKHLTGFTQQELPPRARRIQANPDALSNLLGTTSACAENTSDSMTRTLICGNYLRVRGEYIRRIFGTIP